MSNSEINMGTLYGKLMGQLKQNPLGFMKVAKPAVMGLCKLAKWPALAYLFCIICDQMFHAR